MPEAEVAPGPEPKPLPTQVDKTLHGGVGSYLLFHMALALVEQVSGGARATVRARVRPRVTIRARVRVRIRAKVRGR